MKKAYELSTLDSDYGCRLIFAETRNDAKTRGAGLFSVDYIDVRVRREEVMDKYIDIAIGNELRWDVLESRQALIKELGYQEI